MASRWRQREAGRPSSWRQSLLFNSLLLLLPIMAARIVAGAYTSDIATDPMGLEARTETRIEIEETFRRLSPANGTERSHWANRIEQTLQERDFSAARGYLLAAPLMMDRRDALAVLAAAEAEESGSEDQRLARAALLFLPDNVRASYQRAIAPPRVEMASATVEASEADPVETVDASDDETATDPTDSEQGNTSSAPDPLVDKKRLFLLGDAADLTRQGQKWLAGEKVDSVSLRLRALGLLMQRDDSDEAQSFVEAASLLRAARRADRLNDRFSRYIAGRIDATLPEEAFRATLASSLEPVMTTDQRGELLLDKVAQTADPEALERLTRDMQIIARLAALTSSAGALQLLELASTPEDMRRALLVTEAGGERSIALAREIGPEVLELAQIGVKWTRGLVLQAMALVALGMALLWTAMSAFTQAETIRPPRR